MTAKPRHGLTEQAADADDPPAQAEPAPPAVASLTA